MVRITDSLSMMLANDHGSVVRNSMVRITDSFSMVLAVDRGTVWLG